MALADQSAREFGVSVIVPVAHYHRDRIPHVRDHLALQTLECEVIIVEDLEGRGPAWARHEGVQQSTKEFLFFLDADDQLRFDSIETFLTHWKPFHYVYSDFIRTDLSEDEQHIQLPGARHIGDPMQHHTVSCLISRSAYDYVGGFDENQTGFEDTDFWLRCAAKSICAIHVPEPLMIYQRTQGFSHTVRQRPQFYQRLREIYERYSTMAKKCCGGSTSGFGGVLSIQSTPPEEGFVLVTCEWGGNRRHIGKATGNIYPRSGNGKMAWIDERDLKADSQHYIRVDPPKEPEKPELPIEPKKAIPEPDSEFKEETLTTWDPDDMTVKDLMDFAFERDIEVPKKLRRDDLVQLIQDHLNDAAAAS